MSRANDPRPRDDYIPPIRNEDGGDREQGWGNPKPDYNKMERKEASKDGAKLVKNSGRGSEKGDAKLGNFLVDYKFNAKSFTLNVKNWIKHRKDAWGNGQREPLISIVFGDGTKLAIIEWDVFEELREKEWMWDDLRNS